MKNVVDINAQSSDLTDRIVQSMEGLCFEEFVFAPHYLAEGGANVLFKLELLNTANIDILNPLTRTRLERYQKCLLRVRKMIGGLPYKNTLAIMAEYEQCIKPLLPPQYLLQQSVIELPRKGEGVLRTALLKAEGEGKRPSNRHGEQLAPQSHTAGAVAGRFDDYAILVQDMSPLSPTQVLLEFKPKWLDRSSDASLGFKRCRSCALREMRRADGTPPGRGDSGFCPIDLTSSKKYILRPALRKLWPPGQLEQNGVSEKSSAEQEHDLSEDRTSSSLDRFESEFRRKVHPLLARLKGLQDVHNSVGLLGFDTGEDGQVSVAMALRDCSVCLLVESQPEKMEIKAVKLIDLDLKDTSRGKRDKWIEVQGRLLNEGWYSGRLAPGVEKDEIICRLSRSCT